MSEKDPRPNGESKVRIVQNKKNSGSAPQKPSLSRVRVQKAGDSQGRPSLFAFTLLILYKNLYIIGITILRRRRKYTRRALLLFRRFRGALHSAFYRLATSLKKVRNDLGRRIRAPFLRIRTIYREQVKIIAAAKERGLSPVGAYRTIAAAVAGLIFRILKTIFNYVAPVFAILLLVFLVNGFVNQSMGLEVIYQDVPIGYISREADFEKATVDVKNRLISGSTFTTAIPSFNLVVCEHPDEDNMWLKQYNRLLEKTGVKLVILDEFSPVREIADRIIEVSGSAIEHAYGLYIDNRFYGAVTDKDYLLSLMTNMRERVITGKPNERTEFEKSITLDDGLYPVDSIVDEKDLGELLLSYETVDQVYVVQENDTPSGIADKLGVPYSLLTEINPGIEDSLQVGQQILTAIARPFLSVKSIYTDIYQEELPYETVETPNAIYAKSYRVVDQEGANGVREVTAEVTTINGIEVSRQEISWNILRQPVDEKVTVGVYVPPATTGSSSGSTSGADAAPSTSVSSTGFIWPVASGYVSCGLGGYPGHTGVDIAGSVGTSIYASASGTVRVAKRTYYGYGIYCIIEHDNGYQTLYAHMNDMYVNVGDTVAQGQVIGIRGRTGNVSGPHLHFEVRQNGSIKNPLNYVSP